MTTPASILHAPTVKQAQTSAVFAMQATVRLLVDAEYSYIQPMLDAIVLHMQVKYNRGQAIVFNTYQCYLKDAHPRILADMQHARQAGYVWSAKLVRGAYMHMERQRAVDLGYSCPVHDTLQDTHDNYNRLVAFVGWNGRFC